MLDRVIPRIDPTTIAAVIEANINAYLLSFARLSGAIVHDDARSVWIDSGRADATLNAVVFARFSPDAVDAQVEAVLAHFRQRARPVTWHIGPSTEPSDLGRILLAHGLTHSEDEPGMAVEIDGMREHVTAPPELVVEMVRDARGLEEWVSVARSRRAAVRFGFRYEGLFRQHMVVKGRNRDTAWFAMLDRDWPAAGAAFAAWLAPENVDNAGRQRRSLAALRATDEQAADPA